MLAAFLWPLTSTQLTLWKLVVCRNRNLSRLRCLSLIFPQGLATAEMVSGSGCEIRTTANMRKSSPQHDLVESAPLLLARLQQRYLAFLLPVGILNNKYLQRRTVLPTSRRRMTSSNHDASTGTIAFRVRNETFYTWYTIFGKLKTDLRPLVVLHGGLGMSHDYVLPHSDLSVRSGRPVILYDQIGNGQSSRLKGKRPDLFSFDLFLDELDNLLDHFGITNGFDLLGHSWGGYLAIEFAARRQPPGLKNLVLVGTAASKALWNKGVGRLMDRMPEYVKEGLLHAESSDACKEAKQEFYKSHMCTLDPWPEELNKSFTYEEDDATVHTMMFAVWSLCRSRSRY